MLRKGANPNGELSRRRKSGAYGIRFTAVFYASTIFPATENRGTISRLARESRQVVRLVLPSPPPRSSRNETPDTRFVYRRPERILVAVIDVFAPPWNKMIHSAKLRLKRPPHTTPFQECSKGVPERFTPRPCPFIVLRRFSSKRALVMQLRIGIYRNSCIPILFFQFIFCLRHMVVKYFV